MIETETIYIAWQPTDEILDSQGAFEENPDPVRIDMKEIAGDDHPFSDPIPMGFPFPLVDVEETALDRKVVEDFRAALEDYAWNENPGKCLILLDALRRGEELFGMLVLSNVKADLIACRDGFFDYLEADDMLLREQALSYETLYNLLLTAFVEADPDPMTENWGLGFVYIGKKSLREMSERG